MNITEVKLYSYRLDVHRPLIVKQQQLHHRDGYLLQLCSSAGNGFGDIAPLPGFSIDTLEEALMQIRLLKPFLVAEPIPDGLEQLNNGFDDWLGGLKLTSSVRFGIETAVLNLISNNQQKTLSHMLGNTLHTHVPINGLLMGSRDAILSQADTLIYAGFRSLKLKVNGDVDEAIATVKELTEVINGRALLHLDANQFWSLTDALRFGKAIGPAAVDYIEEPVKDIQSIPEFFHQTLIPVAIDESLQSHTFEEIKGIEGVDVVVIKPSVIGGLEKSWKIMHECQRLGLAPVISSIFESSVGLLTLAQIAGCAARNNSAGLDTAKWFKENLLNTPLEIERGKIEIANRPLSASEIDFNQLIPVDLT